MIILKAMTICSLILCWHPQCNENLQVNSIQAAQNRIYPCCFTGWVHDLQFSGCHSLTVKRESYDYLGFIIIYIGSTDWLVLKIMY